VEFACHELKALKGQVDGPAGESLREVAQAMEEAVDGVNRVAAIVKDLKRISRDDTKRVPTDLRTVIQSATQLSAHELRHRAALIVSLDQVPLIFGSEGRLAQAVVSLLINAAQAFDPARPASDNHVRCSLKRRGDQLVVEVQDNGVGLTPDVQRRIFDPFFTTKPLGKGAGLGLSLSAAIAQAHGGTLEVESAPGKGSTFRLVLPIETPDQPEQAPACAVPAGRFDVETQPLRRS
jgi:two-component system, NtrC family, sensor kinase